VRLQSEEACSERNRKVGERKGGGIEKARGDKKETSKRRRKRKERRRG